MKRVKRPELRLHGQKVRLKKKPVILAVSVLVLIVLLVSVSVHAASKKHTQKYLREWQRKRLQPWKKQRLPKRS